MKFIPKIIAISANILTGGAIAAEIERAYSKGEKTSQLNRDFNSSNKHLELLAKEIIYIFGNQKEPLLVLLTQK